MMTQLYMMFQLRQRSLLQSLCLPSTQLLQLRSSPQMM
jgi:hypothetical protein